MRCTICGRVTTVKGICPECEQNFSHPLHNMSIMNTKEIDELGRDYIKNYLYCLENLSSKLVNDPDDDDTADTIQYLMDSKQVVGDILSALRSEINEKNKLWEDPLAYLSSVYSMKKVKNDSKPKKPKKPTKTKKKKESKWK